MSGYFDITYYEDKPTIDELAQLDTECEQLVNDLGKEAAAYYSQTASLNLSGPPFSDLERIAIETKKGLLKDYLVEGQLSLIKKVYLVGEGLIRNGAYGIGIDHFERYLEIFNQPLCNDPALGKIYNNDHKINEIEYVELRTVISTLIRYYMRIGSITCDVQCPYKLVPGKNFNSNIFNIVSNGLNGMNELVSNITRDENARSECIAYKNDPNKHFNNLVGISPEWLEVLENIIEAAEYLNDAAGNKNAIKKSVLIKGPTGIGKENIVNAIAGLVGNKKVLPINCSFFGDLIVTELFGYVKGSHDKALKDTKGLCHAVEGKVLFLDEIHTTMPVHQPKLLRLIEAHKFIRFGGTEEENFKGIIVAAINQDVRGLVKDGKLLVDLYHRLNRYHVNVPRLSTRPSDIEELIIHYIDNHHKEFHISQETIDEICNFFMHQTNEQSDDPLAGNVRELQNIIEELVLKIKRLNKKNSTVKKNIDSTMLNSEYKKSPHIYRRGYYSIPEPPRAGNYVNYLKNLDAVTLTTNSDKKNIDIIAKLLNITKRSVENRIKRA